MKTYSRKLIITGKYLFVFFLLISVARVWPNEVQARLTEDEKIRRLIVFVRNLKGAVFIRNDSEHTTGEAADHMELKLKKAGNQVKTAIQFIDLCASKSTLSGKDYQVRLSGGKTVKSSVLLMEELKRIERLNN